MRSDPPRAPTMRHPLLPHESLCIGLKGVVVGYRYEPWEAWVEGPCLAMGGELELGAGHWPSGKPA